MSNKHFIQKPPQDTAGIAHNTSFITLNHHKIFRETSFGCPKMIKIKTGQQTNKQTNKQLNISLDPKYISQIKSDLHKTLR